MRGNFREYRNNLEILNSQKIRETGNNWTILSVAFNIENLVTTLLQGARI